MINLNQLKTEIIENVLRDLKMYSPQAVNLLLGTAAQESALGSYIKQVGGGPALGIFQMEPSTHDDILDNYLIYNDEISEKIGYMGYNSYHSSIMLYDMRYAAIFARLHYRRQPKALPNTVSEMAAYWKKYYNTKNGKGTKQEFIDNYHKYVKLIN